MKKQKAKAREKNLTNFTKKIENATMSETELNAYDALKVGQENILEYFAQGSFIRSRIETIELNEKSNNYFPLII